MSAGTPYVTHLELLVFVPVYLVFVLIVRRLRPKGARRGVSPDRRDVRCHACSRTSSHHESSSVSDHESALLSWLTSDGLLASVNVLASSMSMPSHKLSSAGVADNLGAPTQHNTQLRNARSSPVLKSNYSEHQATQEAGWRTRSLAAHAARQLPC